MNISEYDIVRYGLANLYDDPYKMLATQIVSRLSVPLLQRFLVDNDYVKQVITHDIQSLDIASPFVDAVQDVLYRKHEKVKYKQALAVFAMFIYRELDIARLRREIRDFLEGCDIPLE